jgi:hypothetical protein
MLIITKEAKRAMESRVFRRVLLGSDFPGGTLGFLGHLISPTVSEANVEGRPTIRWQKGGEHREAEVLANTELSGLRNPSEPPGPHR